MRSKLVFLRDLLPDVVNTRYQRLCLTASTFHPKREEYFDDYKDRVSWWQEGDHMENCIKARNKAEALNQWMKTHKAAIHSICDRVRCLSQMCFLSGDS